MELFLDSSNPREILEARSWGLLSGVTTNPGLIAAAGPDMEKTLREVVDASPGPVSGPGDRLARPRAADPPGPLAARFFGQGSSSSCRSASRASRRCRQLKRETARHRLAVTAVASVAQAYLAGKAGRRHRGGLQRPAGPGHRHDARTGRARSGRSTPTTASRPRCCRAGATPGSSARWPWPAPTSAPCGWSSCACSMSTRSPTSA